MLIKDLLNKIIFKNTWLYTYSIVAIQNKTYIWTQSLLLLYLKYTKKYLILNKKESQSVCSWHTRTNKSMRKLVKLLNCSYLAVKNQSVWTSDYCMRPIFLGPSIFNFLPSIHCRTQREQTSVNEKDYQDKRQKKHFNFENPSPVCTHIK